MFLQHICLWYLYILYQILKKINYPDCDSYDSKKSDLFNKIVYESMCGKGHDEWVKHNKIIHQINL